MNPSTATAAAFGWTRGPEGIDLGRFMKAVLALLVLTLLLVPMGAALVYLPWLPFALIALGVLVLLFALRTDVGLGITLGSLALGVCGDLNEDGTITVTKLFVMLVATTWVTRALIVRDMRLVQILSRDVATLFLWGFLLWGCVSVLWSVGWVGSIAAIVRIFSLAGTYVVVMAIVASRRIMLTVLTLSLIAGGLVCIGGIYEMVTQQSIQTFFGKSRHITVATTTGTKLSSRKYGEFAVPASAAIAAETEGTWSRVLATFGSENEYAIYICGLLGPALAFWFATRRRALKWLLAGVIVLIVTNIIGTGSRGGLLSLIMLFLVYLLCARFPLKWPLIAGLVPAVGGILFVVPAVFEQFRSGFTLDAMTSDPRWYLYQMELAMFADRPFTGMGFGSFYTHYRNYHIPGAPFWPMVAHNVPLQTLAETGIVGATLWISFCASVIYGLILAVRASRGPLAWHLSVGFLASVCAYALNSLMENSLGMSHFWATMGLGLAWAAIVHAEKRGFPRPYPKSVQRSMAPARLQ